MRTFYTWDDLTEDIRDRVVRAERAASLISEAIRTLSSREMHATVEELLSLQKGLNMAKCIANRQAAGALSALRIQVEEADNG